MAITCEEASLTFTEIRQSRRVMILLFSWLNYDWKDNSGALTWLAETLWNAELNGEKVHIMSHIPPGNGDCLGAWGRNYARIVERQFCEGYLVHLVLNVAFI